MEHYEVEVSEPAENDLRDIVRYISAQLAAPITALKMLDSIESAILTLSDMPQSHSVVADDRLSSLGYRKLIVKNYIVFFTVNEKEKVVNVERILYARRDWAYIL